MSVITNEERAIQHQYRLVEALQESELRYRTLVNNLKEVLFQTDIEGLWTFLNPAWEEITGFSVKESLGEYFLDRIYSDDRELSLQLFKPLIERDETFCQYEIRYCHKDGSYRWIAVFIQLTLNDQGEMTGTTGSLTDITIRKHLELAQQKFQDELELAASVFSDSPMGIMITDAEGIILRINTAFSSITGYSATEALGQSPRLIKSDQHDELFYQKLWESLTETGQWEGEIWNRRKNGEVFPEWGTITAVKNKSGEISHYINSFIDISEKKISQDRVYHLAHYDVLTNLPNRALFMDHLGEAVKHAKRSKGKVAVLFFDLDNFKIVNDTMGHASGDTLLKEIARHLQEAVREVDVIARLGGDEFTVMLTSTGPSPLGVATVADKIMAVTSSPVTIDGKQIMVSASLGISIYPDDACDAGILLKNADIAMYRAKTEGKNNYLFFTDEMNREITERQKLEHDLRQAITEQQFVLYYQPQVELESNTITAVEALIRWQHPEKGMLSPLKFIPIAEEVGLIVDIGKWVLEEACRQQLAWKAAGFDIRVAVNISTRQLQDNHLHHFIKSLLDSTSISPEKLELELTETSLMDDPQRAIDLLKTFEALGLPIALDDFGTGYSSLSYLKRFPINTLKIDQSFVHDLPEDLHDAAIATTVIAMARSLGLKVLAEGVETAEQLAFLRERGCDDVQATISENLLPLMKLSHCSPATSGNPNI